MSKGRTIAALAGLAAAGWAFYIWAEARQLERPWGDVARAHLARYGWPAAGTSLAALALLAQLV